MTTPTFIGDEFVVNSTTSQDQYQQSIAALADGGFVIAWRDESRTGDDTSQSAVRAQRFAADGTPLGDEFLVNTTTANYQYLPCVTGLEGGGFVVAWTDTSVTGADASGFAIRAQRFASDGTPQGDEFLVNTTTAGDQYQPSIAGLQGGGFVITWGDWSMSGDDTSYHAVRAQRFAADGTPQGVEFVVNTTTENWQYEPSVTGLADGGFVITWTDESQTGADASGSAIRAQRYAADGTPQGGEFLVNTSTDDYQWVPSLAGLADGGFVIAWQDWSRGGDDPYGAAVRAQLFAADGTPQGDEFVVNTTTVETQQNPSVAALPDGGFVIAWQDWSQTGGDTSGTAIRAQRFAADGTAVGDEFLVNTTTTGNQYWPEVAALEDGRFVIVWDDSSMTGDDTSGHAVRAQIFEASTGPVPIEGTDGDDTLTGTADADTIMGYEGNDLLAGLAGADVIYGGGGIDTADYRASDAGVAVNLAKATASGGHAEGDLLVSIENLAGSAYGDVLIGNGAANRLDGGPGNDTLKGGGGDDVLLGGVGNDLLDGGKGRDMADFDSKDRVTVDLAITGVQDTGQGKDKLKGIEDLAGGAANDLLKGNGVDNLLMGRDGNDKLIGRGGADTLDGGAGNDVLNGGGGKDRLEGGAGVDKLTGGKGADVFVFSAGDDCGVGTGNRDVITDFGAGADVIDLSGMDADPGAPGDQAFSFIGKAAFSGTAGELRYTAKKAFTLVQIDFDGDGAKDFEIELTGKHALDADDFLL